MKDYIIYKCIDDINIKYGFKKDNYYMFDTRYGLMHNYCFGEYYFWKPYEYGFKQIKSNIFIDIWIHALYICHWSIELIKAYYDSWRQEKRS